MNDIMMDEVLRDEKGDEGECVIEDAVSISTDVIEEVDETELSRLRLHSLKETPPPERQQSEVEQEAQPSHEDSHCEEEDNVVSRFSEELPSTSKDDEEKHRRTPQESEEEEEEEDQEKTPTAEASSFSVIVESKTIEITNGRKSPSVIEEESLSESEDTTEVKKKDDDVESVSEEEIMIEDVATPTVQKAFDPPSIPPKSIMYADTSSEEDSDDELEREILPPVQRSQKVIDFEKIRVEPTQNGILESESTTVASNTFEDSGSDEERIVGDGPKFRDYKAESLTVTRIVVRDDGKPDELTCGPVKMTLDGREAITDEEFSEKLI
ncbi:hypothetical protein OESDEN_09205 [Oesophagostomum dentatum]|uniref:Uncharacterized protein n=1 Tax=Oesophagostomum dentatum TaxID=61180 RepID=A0A0B1T119_OESDE|nr:hypothetical protein OESDEN_09205 [Oesophagostomum dentatum]